jgi:hypothetical protein
MTMTVVVSIVGPCPVPPFRNLSATGFDLDGVTVPAQPEGWDDVLGEAFSGAVRRAVTSVGRAPLAELADGDAEAHDRDRDRNDDDDHLHPGDGDVLAGWAPPPPPPQGVEDPYAILGIGRSAPWEQIVAAHRRLARLWHPDGAEPGEAAAREDLIRRLNVAYAELRVRRGR